MDQVAHRVLLPDQVDLHQKVQDQDHRQVRVDRRLKVQDQDLQQVRADQVRKAAEPADLQGHPDHQVHHPEVPEEEGDNSYQIIEYCINGVASRHSIFKRNRNENEIFLPIILMSVS
jgi:hypothetical protein